MRFQVSGARNPRVWGRGSVRPAAWGYNDTDDEEDGSKVRVGCELHHEGVAGLSGPRRVLHANIVPRVGNQCMQKGCKTKCAKARGQCVGACGGCREKRDSKDEDEEREGEESERFSLDRCFLGDENGARIKFLVGRKRVIGMAMAAPCLPAAMKVLQFVKECGAAESDIILDAA